MVSYLQTVTDPSSNWAQCRTILLIKANVLKVKGLDIYIPPLTGKPWPAAVYNSKWRTDRQ